MISFIICLALLIGGYFVYGKVVENTFAPDDRETPAVRINDGVDYVVMPQWKLFLVQLLNIAGLGPIFGAMQGALWGPVVFLWITFGTIFAGGVHDYFSGMLSERNDGASISEVCGIYLGNVMKNVMRVFSVVLLVMVGTVFAVGPAGLIVTLLGNKGVTGALANPEVWLWIILAYYFVATFISISRNGLFLIPALLILPRFLGLNGVLYSSSVSDFCSLILVSSIYIKISVFLPRIIICIINLKMISTGSIFIFLLISCLVAYFIFSILIICLKAI